MNIQVKGCGCRYRIRSTSFNPYEECDHLCDQHKDEFILKLYNHDRNTITWKKMVDAHRQGYEEWKKVSDAMYEQHMKDNDKIKEWLKITSEINNEMMKEDNNNS